MSDDRIAALIDVLTDALDADCLSGIRFESMSLLEDPGTTEEERNDAIRVLLRAGLIEAARRRVLI